MNQFLKENNGQSSSTRLIFFVGSLWAMYITTYLVLKGESGVNVVITYTSIMGVLTGLKLGQKAMEK